MMGYLNEALQRASVQSLRAYFLYGVDGERYSTDCYEMRIKKAYEKWYDVVGEYENDVEDSRLYQVVCEVITEYEHVYMEMGIQAGFKLAREINQQFGDIEKNSEQYKEMYGALFRDITKVIEDLQRAQRVAEEMYISNLSR